jgi:hypothetical protein
VCVCVCFLGVLGKISEQKCSFGPFGGIKIYPTTFHLLGRDWRRKDSFALFLGQN